MTRNSAAPTNDREFQVWEDGRLQGHREARRSPGAIEAVTIASVFPFSITIGGVSVKLNVDGTWDGDLVAFKRAVAEMQGNLGNAGVLAWLVLREMIRDDKRFW